MAPGTTPMCDDDRARKAALPRLDQLVEHCTAAALVTELAGNFAYVYLAEEVV